MAKIKEFKTEKGFKVGYEFHCPGCDLDHQVFTDEGYCGHSWKFNGDVDKPTFNPSVRISGFDWKKKKDYECHFFIKEGKIQFCGDCSHDMSGKTVEMEEIKGE